MPDKPLTSLGKLVSTAKEEVKGKTPEGIPNETKTPPQPEKPANPTQ